MTKLELIELNIELKKEIEKLNEELYIRRLLVKTSKELSEKQDKENYYLRKTLKVVL